MKIKLEDKIEKPKIEFCKHNDYCSVRKNRGGNCFAADEPRYCESYKFYERYGEQWNQLGVGS